AHDYNELFAFTPVERAAATIAVAAPGVDALDSMLDAGERFAMLLERIDEMSLERHDFGGSANALLAGFVRRIDLLKAHLIGSEEFARWAQGLTAGAEPADAAL